MKNKTKYSKGENLIPKFLNGEFPEKDELELEKWLQEDPENQKIFLNAKNLWSLSENLNTIESINTNKDWELVKNRIEFNKIKATVFAERKSRFTVWQIAATVIILLGVGFLSKQFLFTTPDSIRVVSNNQIKEIILPDGSTVVLNKNTELIYPERFKKQQRQVTLSGEAFFEITKNPDKTFRVNVDELATVEVLGTSFNINSDKEKDLINVNVVSGLVAFFTKTNQETKTLLKKEEGALFEGGIISKKKRKNKNFLSWRTGVISFEDEQIDVVCKTLSEFYNTLITTENLNPEVIRFTSAFDNEKLENVLEEIKLVLQLETKKFDNKIILYKPDN
jgi:ferric-dicitrate binding protein FerR (iron transport regulator)